MSADTDPAAPSPEKLDGADVPAFGHDMAIAYRLAMRAATTTLSVFILGEPGVGKEFFARSIHRSSQRASAPLVVVDCAALGANQVNSELFGHERDAFAGAGSAKLGAFEAAMGGTLVLDDVSDLDLEMQAKLSSVLEDGAVLPLGATEPRAIDVRLVATSQRDLRQEVARGRFRVDLYYRLTAVVVHLPPLRQRRSDIAPLARFFLRKFARERDASVPRITAEARALFEKHTWPGNVGELERSIERAALLARGGPIRPEHVQLESCSSDDA